ncbi:ATP-binding cassette domain-containing protein [Geobacillus thermodenitrificans]|uniref:energy-coupling factor ABC transporter ATP-binding protein n=1 Tax=Geobacillus thermodenitrificans TaxID=33940 RepID=UPI002E1C220A|nr:ATP-binding cassette domain-containing protein [Geobacillus thermodenitrificans]MED3716499.1 ATP-binding cassette domain-containing protein [Geobacillus thermodenitrificans]
MIDKNAVVVKNLTFRYPNAKKTVLNNISFTLEQGEILGIIGPTGAGKTTLAMCLNSLIPSVIHGELQGEVIVLGKNVSEKTVAEMSEVVGFVFQEPENQLSQMTVEEEIAFGLGNLGIQREEMVKRIQESLEQVGLSGLEKRSPLALSGGQQQRLAIAAVLAMRPAIMIMDEPTSMLDPRGKNEVYDVLKRIKSYGMTGIIIDHEVERMADYCDKILLMDSGEVKAFGTPREVFLQLDLLHRLQINSPQVTELAGRLEREIGVKIEHPVTIDEAKTVFRNIDI